MMRGTFANIRLRNQLAPGTEGSWTLHLPDGEKMYIYDAAVKYREEGVPLFVLAGKEYGSGSSRDWAAKGTRLLGVRAVLAESFERIHRSNLVAWACSPSNQAGESRESLGLTGQEVFDVEGVSSLTPRKQVTGEAKAQDGSVKTITALAPRGHSRRSFLLPARRHSPIRPPPNVRVASIILCSGQSSDWPLRN